MRTVSLTVALTVLSLNAQAAPKRTLTQPARAVTQADKAFILNWMRTNLVDPYSLRSTGISEPTRLVGNRGRKITVICVELNAQSRVAGYTGIDRYAFAVTPEGLAYGDWRQGVKSSNCYDPQIVIRPFPELASIK